MKRREWLKKAALGTSGLMAMPSMVHQLMAAPLSEAERKFTMQAGSKIRLNANENPYGPSPAAREAIIQAIAEGNRYPFATLDTLRNALAEKEGVSPDYIHIGAGSGSLLCQAGIVFGLEGGGLLSGFPTFPVLMSYGEVFNCRWDKINLTEKLEYDYDAVAKAVKPDTKLAVICNPNNPTGTLVDPSKVKAFTEEVSKKVPVFSDEAYLEFLEPSQQVSMLDLVKQGKNVVVCRTFSKVYGLAGMRLGYLVARPAIIEKFERYAPDIPMSQTGIAAALASLNDKGFMATVRGKNAAARQVLTSYLDSKKIFYGQSHTNFVFFQAPAKGSEILKKMSDKGFLIRIWDYQGKEWCRVSIGLQEEMKKFVEAFSKEFA